MQNKVHGFKLNGDKYGCPEKCHGGSRTIPRQGGYKLLDELDERKKTGMKTQSLQEQAAFIILMLQRAV
jgi:hypothetical protein